MARRWRSLPTVLGMGLTAAGILFIAVPNWDRARLEYRRAMEQYVDAGGADVGSIDTAVGTVIAVVRTVLFTFATGVVEHPILTVLLGVGSLLLGIVLVLEYGLLAENDEPWHDEWDMK